MYRKIYGQGKNFSRQNTMILRERTLRSKAEMLRSKIDVLSCLCSYGEERSKPRPHQRDALVWEKMLNEVLKKQLEEVRERERLFEEKERLEADKVEELKKLILMVQKVDLHVQQTTIDHHTDLFDCTDGFDGQLVVRRGQEFPLTFDFQRPWSGKDDNLFLVFTLGENPNKSKGSKVRFRLDEVGNTNYMTGAKRKWGARILSQNDNSLTVSVYVPPNAVIGQWEYAVVTELEEDGKRKRFRYNPKDDVIVLLNPWCKDDQVYMEDVEGLSEYIDNECGCVFNGSRRGIGTKSWFYGQFQEDILEISLHLLRKAFNYDVTPKMADPVHISRALSRIMNSSDDNGVLVGNWSGKYDGGTKPTHWKGSVNILREYFNTKEPVKFGQCWVFSHLLTTVARAIGLPCRSITNFSSAHDTNNSMTIDRFVDDEGDVISWRTTDSIWNFHVWNEVWMHRPDLDLLMSCQGKYDGWAAIDATPQEASEDLYQCGPSPIEAIRCGDVHVGYDTKFIFAEVNAEVCRWRETNSEMILVSKTSNSVGRTISTKVPNGEPMNSSWFASDEDNRLDITHLYKHPEGSVAERESVVRALSGTELVDQIFSNPTGIEIHFEPIDEPKLGEDFTVTVKVVNTSDEERSVRLRMTVRPMTYWGDVIGTKTVASKLCSEVKIGAKDSQSFDLHIEADQYLVACDEQLAMSLLAMAHVRHFADHENRVYESEDFKVKSGPIKIEGPTDPVQAGQPMQIKVTLTNPINMTLTDCHLEVEGGVEVMDEEFVKKHSGYKLKIDDIPANGVFETKLTIKPKVKPVRSRHREVEIGFDSKELPDFEGAFKIKLEK